MHTHSCISPGKLNVATFCRIAMQGEIQRANLIWYDMVCNRHATYEIVLQPDGLYSPLYAHFKDQVPL